ncbi:MAG: [Fe-Fe] hydrogenase large subunit C-terminal domain-containing protein, partial [Intestinibacter sp.]
YHADTKVVFIGPCLAKKEEGSADITVDAVLTFAELQKWFNKENIDLDTLEESDFDVICKDRLLFPIVGQTTHVVNAKNPVKKVITVEGINDCIDILHALEKGRFKNTIFEMSGCVHSCLNGSGIDNQNITYQEREINVRNYREKCKIKYKDFDDKYPYEDYLEKTPLKKVFLPKKTELKIPDDESLHAILKSMGKNSISDELNCGGCGHKTCRNHAIAIYNEISEINMCSPYMRQKAENIANLIFEASPFLIGILDKEVNILEFNTKAEEFFKITKEDYVGFPIFMYIDDSSFYKCLNENRNIYNDITSVEDMNKTLSQDIFWLPEEQIFLWMAHDITDKIEHKKHELQKKYDTVELAQEVINKQMTVVQEIGKLLGETTAETKVIFSRLKNIINDDITQSESTKNS